MRSKKVQESIEIFKSWIDFNKNNKNIVNKADKLIEVQENILSYIETLEQLPNKIRDKIKELKETADEDNMEDFLQIGVLEELLGE